MNAVVETRGLCKQYGPALRVNHLDLTVPEGAVYGFLGPNGAGKSTTLKLLLGLARPTAGEIAVFGRPMGPRTRMETLSQVGSLIESPSYYGHLTGDLYWQGSGDPAFDRDALADMARTVRARGIGQIDGRLLLDGQVFRTLGSSSELDPDEGRSYQVGPDALLTQFNVVAGDSDTYRLISAMSDSMFIQAWMTGSGASVYATPA